MDAFTRSEIKRTEAIFRQCRVSFDTEIVPPWSVRKRRLTRLRRLVTDHADALSEAIAADFHGRRTEETLLCEVSQTLSEIDLMLSCARSWMRAYRMRTPWRFFPAQSRTVAQPRGVVGIFAAWNYPLVLSAAPVADALAAGNRVIVKLPERTPVFSALFARLLSEAFPAQVLSAVTGGVEVARALSSLPFDLILYTGNRAVGQEVMAAAAKNLTPVILELGGKSETVIAPGAAMGEAVRRILVGKLTNAGQTCIAPDIVRVEREALQAFVSEAKRWVKRLCPDPKKATGLIDNRQAERLDTLLTDAQEKGARIETLLENVPGDARRMGLKLVIDPGEDARIIQEEIFGPLLLVQTYEEIEDVIALLKRRSARPLALYWFDRDAARVQRVMHEVPCGGITVNDTLLHFAQNRLPFGGVGESGFGAYHGKAGFDAMSHRVPVFMQSRLSAFGLLDPPYSALARRLIRFFAR